MQEKARSYLVVFWFVPGQARVFSVRGRFNSNHDQPAIKKRICNFPTGEEKRRRKKKMKEKNCKKREKEKME